MRELEEEKIYTDKVRFTIIPNTQKGFAKEVAQFDIGNHGLVAFDAKGEVAAKIAGHSFGKAEILKAMSSLTDK